MEKLHKDLCDKYTWYSAYHSFPSTTFLNFAVLVIVAITFASSIQITLAQNITSAAVAQNSSEQNSAQLVGQILRATKQYNAANVETKAIAEQKLRSLIEQRKSLMLTEAVQNPHGFLLNALPEGITKQLPDFARTLLEAEVIVEGNLTVLHADALPETDPGYSKSYEQTIHFLESNNTSGKKTYHLIFSSKIPDGLETGTKIRVKGVALDTVLVPFEAAGGSSETTIISQPSQEAATDVKNVLIILLNFTNSTSQPFTREQMAGTVFNNPNSTNAFYQETSFNKIAMTGDVVGWYTIPYDNTNCSTMYNTWSNAAEQAAVAAGVVVSSYPHRIYVFNSNPSCGWGGLGTVGGNPTKAWIPGYNTADIYAHEFGHNLRSRHAQWLKCGSLAVDTYTNCTTDEYGDRSDVMGYAWGIAFTQNNGSRKIGQTWLTTLEHMQTVTSNGNYTISATEYSDMSTKVLKIAKPNTNEQYYVFYRNPFGFDAKLPAAFFNGATVNIWNGSITTATKLVDTTPGDNSWSNAPLADGRIFSDPANGISISQVSHASSSVTLNVQFSQPACVRVAPTLIASPLSHSAQAGESKTYTLTLTNNDSSSCASSTFALSSSVPSGFTASFSSPSVALSQGASGSVSMTVTSVLGTADGSYSITALANDSSIVGHSASASVTYVAFTPVQDTVSPTVVIASPEQGSVVTNGNVTLSASASDESGVATIVIKADSKTLKTCSNTLNCNYNWRSRDISNGIHTIEVVATDKSNNSNVGSATVTFQYGSTTEPPPPPPPPPTEDVTPPVVSITSPASGTILKGNSSVTVSVSASDASGIANISIAADGVTIASCSNSSICSTSYGGKNLGSGTYTLTATAVDASANQNQAATSIIIIK